MTHPKDQPKPVNLDGQWGDPKPEDGYDRYFAGPAEVRFHPGYEPDGELVTRERVSVHAERMDKGQWSIILTAPNGHDIHIDLHSKSKIKVLWRDEPPLAEQIARMGSGTVTVTPRCTCEDVGYPGTCQLHNVTYTGPVS